LSTSRRDSSSVKSTRARSRNCCSTYLREGGTGSARSSGRFVFRQEHSRSFKELLLNLSQGRRDGQREEFWALRDVSFAVEPGEALALIGPNGAGKSTVLKLISRIISPTSGRVEVNGRVGALLQLGAGFHGDLTGRENIYLNASILGLSRAEIRRKMDAIIAFSELERFIDIPVKRYSSGMYVRLGFSVAVHTDPEILLIDEVLAVGDQNFQHKCTERIMEMKQDGITLCFVSHALPAVRRLCSRAIWLNDGIVQAEGDVEDVISAYLGRSAEEEAARIDAEASQAKAKEKKVEAKRKRQWGTGDVRIVNVSFLDASGKEQHVFRVGEPWTVKMHYHAYRRVERPVFGLAVYRSDGVHVCGPNTYFAGMDIPYVEGEGDVLYRVDHLPLMEGTYSLSVAVVNQPDTVTYDHQDRLHTFRVRQVGRGERYGVVSLEGEWEWDSRGKR